MGPASKRLTATEADSPAAATGRGQLIRRVLAIALILAVAWVLLVGLPVARIAWSFMAGSGSTPLELLLPSDPTFRLSTSVDGVVVTGRGETSLPDASHVQMWATFWGDAPGIHISDVADATVRDGSFAQSFDLTGWPAGQVAVNALFEMDVSQPVEVTVRYGAKGERLSGPRVVFDDDEARWALQDWQTTWVGARVAASAGPSRPAAANPGTFHEAGPMTVPRSSHSAALLQSGNVLVVGGDRDCSGDACVLRATAEWFDAKTNSFSATSPMVHAREHATASTLQDGRVLIAGGYDDSGSARDSAELYDPSTNTFAMTGSMSSPRADMSSTLLADGRVLLVGGVGSLEGAQASAELYDPTTGRFTPTGPMGTPRNSHTASILADGRVLIIGGVGDVDTLSSAEVYDPATGMFNATGSMAQPRQVHAATALADGRVLVAGGLGLFDQGQVSSAEIFDPASGRFAATGSMSQARNFLTTTLLRDGRVLVAGGFDAGETVPLVELYDPSAGTFAPVGNMLHGSDGPTATLLADGRVLIAGGAGEHREFAPRAELYEPGT
jgi:galactose oxidase-like protein